MNKTTPTVRYRAVSGAANAVGDRRVRRTNLALVQALVALVQEKRYDAITIQDLLDRADVGRSTFYSHYRGKDDLLFRSFERMLAGLAHCLEREGPSHRLAPVRELFAHVGQMKRFQQALARAHVLERQLQVGIGVLSRTIEQRLAGLPPSIEGDTVPASVRAQAYAGALFALLRWWLEHDAPYTPEQMDDMYHGMLNPS